MIDWLTVLLALAIIAGLVGVFGFMAWKINMPDPLVSGKDDGHQSLFDSVTSIDKKKKDKSGAEQSKKKQKERKKGKRDQKEQRENGEQQQQHRRGSQNTVTFKEPSTPTSEESDDEREESEQESLIPATVVAETASSSSKARKRNKNKPRAATPPPPNRSSSHIEGILANKNEKSPVTTARVQSTTQLKSTAAVPKDEVELAKQHPQVKTQAKPQAVEKQTLPATTGAAKKAVQPATTNQGSQKLQQEQQEQPFTTVVSNRHKAGTPPLQQQQQTKSVTAAPTATPLPVAAAQQPPAVQVQQEPLGQRQFRQQPLQQKEAPSQINGFASKQPTAAAAPMKISDLIKALPTSQAVVTELMTALDASSLSTDELDIVMQKIANKQSVLKQDWEKLRHGQKVDPQAHIGQVMDASAKAVQEDMKNNAVIRVNELTNELNTEKRRVTDLLKEKAVKDAEIQVIRAQLDSVQQQKQQQQQHQQHQQPSVIHPQVQHQLQSLQAQLQRLNEENNQLKHQIVQQQQQQFASNTQSNVVGSDESTLAKVNMLTDHVRTLSVRNGELEKQSTSNERLVKEAQKEKDDLIRYNQQLTQSLQDLQKQVQHNEEKIRNEVNDTRTSYANQINDYKRRIEKLELDNEQLRREEIVHVEPPSPTQNTSNEERERLERELNTLKQTDETNRQRFEQINQEKQRLTEEFEQLKRNLDENQAQSQSRENELRQQIDRLKQERENDQQVNNERRQLDESHTNELSVKNAQIDALRAELDEAKARNDSNVHEKQRNVLTSVLPEELRDRLPADTQDFDQWLSSYQQVLQTNKQTLQEECATLKRENDKLHTNMSEVERQLKEIERTVQSKEELLLVDLQSKDATLEGLRTENDQMSTERQHLRAEIDRLQLEHDAAVTEARALKVQLDERFLVAANSPTVVADESFELIKQPTPSTSPIVIDVRAEQLNELIRSGNEALENQDSLVQRLGRHLEDMHRGGSGTGETSTDNVSESTVSSSNPFLSDQQQQHSES